jgi:ABC-2 type transport system permease protein
MFLLLFAFVFGGAITITTGDYREYLVGGVVAQTLVFGMYAPANKVANDLTQGIVDRFRTLPSRRAAYLLGHYLAELGGVLVASTVLFGTGALIGWRIRTDLWHAGAALALILVFASAMIWIGTWIGMVVRAPDAVGGIVFITIFPLSFLSSAFVPIDTMPAALEHVAAWNPMSAVVGAIRELFGNPATATEAGAWPVRHPVAAAWAYSVLLLALGVTAALRTFDRRTTD